MILDDIVHNTRRGLAGSKAGASLDALQERPLFRAPRHSLRDALAAHRRAIIAEVKKASPSKGVIRPDFDAVGIATAYAANGAAAISVLTEPHYFQGSLDHLAAIREKVDVPLLRKDFLLDPYQLYEARAYGADAVLLIVAILDDALLHELLRLAEELNLAAMVEVHDRADLDRALRCGASLLGINNRDLRTFHTTLSTTEELLPAVPRDAVVIAESGIDTTADIERLERAGVRAFLIGEALMRAADPGARLAGLMGSGPVS